MRFLLFLFASFALAGPTMAESQPGDVSRQADAGLPGAVTYEIWSWGRLGLRWQVNPNGTGEIWRSLGDAGRGRSHVAKYRFHLNAEALRSFIAAAEPVRAATRNGVSCTEEVSDTSYGSIVWDYPGQTQTYRFVTGRHSSAADAVIDQIEAVTAVIETLGDIESEPYTSAEFQGLG